MPRNVHIPSIYACKGIVHIFHLLIFIAHDFLPMAAIQRVQPRWLISTCALLRLDGNQLGDYAKLLGMHFS